jgi:serine/threonine protein kinase
LGIAHGDISTWNLLIDPETDKLKLFDFNMADKLGHEENRNDVKLAIITVYEIITRDVSFREEEYWPDEVAASTALQMEEWEQHPNVRLEEGVTVSEYRRVLADWVNDRRQGVNKDIRDYKQALEAIDWPAMPEFSLVDCAGTMMRRPSQMRQGMIRRGEPFIKWYVSTLCVSIARVLMLLCRQRPPTRHLPLPAGKRLLATGEVVDDILQAEVALTGKQSPAL